MAEKVALITGITGQDGAYLARLLLDKGYVVHGIKRRSSSFNTGRIDDLYIDPHEGKTRLFLHYGDLTDAANLIRVLQETQPQEIYNLAAQSHVQVSFETPEYTANADALGTLRLLEAIRILGMEKRVRFYQASTSELFGKTLERPQRETTPFYPRQGTQKRSAGPLAQGAPRTGLVWQAPRRPHSASTEAATTARAQFSLPPLRLGRAFDHDPFVAVPGYFMLDWLEAHLKAGIGHLRWGRDVRDGGLVFRP